MMSGDPVSLALRLADGGDLDADGLDWLQTGLRRWLAGETDSLEVALRLAGGSRIAARNRALRNAAEVLADGRALSAWALAGLLSEAIKRFESRVLPRLRADPAAPLTGLDTQLLAAHRAGAVWMRSRRRLYDLLRA